MPVEAVSDAFLDTNIVVYAFGREMQTSKSRELLEQGCVISVQVLNEFANVARRKIQMEWSEIRDSLASIRLLCSELVPVDAGVHEAAMHLASRYNFSVYDANLVAAALRAGCTTLWSEDMHHGLLVEGQLTIRNPFLEPRARG